LALLHARFPELETGFPAANIEPSSFSLTSALRC